MTAETSQTLDRGLRVLKLLADTDHGLTVTELSNKLGVNRTVVYRLLATLEQHTLVRRDLGAVPGSGSVCCAWAARCTRSSGKRRCPRSARSPRTSARRHTSPLSTVRTRSPSRWSNRRGRTTTWRTGRASATRWTGARPGARSSPPGRACPTGPATRSPTANWRPKASGAAAPLVGVTGVEGSVGVVMLADSIPERVGPRVVDAAREVAEALR